MAFPVRAVGRRPVDADGRRRCRWTAGDPLLIDYHDREWGRPIGDDAGHLERMTLEVFQCGLSWRIVLVKRPALRDAFRDFDPPAVARLTAADVGCLLRHPGIIRNRRKIEATIENARRMLTLAAEHGSYARWFAAQATTTARQRAALFDQLCRTFRFMGPETARCYLMGCGKIRPAHDRGCFAASGGRR